MDPDQPPLFPLPGSHQPGRGGWSKAAPGFTCEDCIRARTGTHRPQFDQQAAVWRLRRRGTVTFLCDPHAQQRGKP